MQDLRLQVQQLQLWKAFKVTHKTNKKTNRAPPNQTKKVKSILIYLLFFFFFFKHKFNSSPIKLNQDLFIPFLILQCFHHLLRRRRKNFFAIYSHFPPFKVYHYFLISCACHSLLLSLSTPHLYL